MLRRNLLIGHAVAQADSRRLKSCGICGEQSGTGAGFLPVLRFLLPLLSSGAGTIGSTVADVPSVLGLIPP
jgi:hypothetical protein